MAKSLGIGRFGFFGITGNDLEPITSDYLVLQF